MYGAWEEDEDTGRPVVIDARPTVADSTRHLYALDISLRLPLNIAFKFANAIGQLKYALSCVQFGRLIDFTRKFSVVYKIKAVSHPKAPPRP